MVTEAERWWAENQRQSVKNYEDLEPWRIELANYVAAGNPRSVFEFGCGVGNNLCALERWEPEIREVHGCDISPVAVRKGRDAGRVVGCCADRHLENVMGSHDIVFTCSVLDHIPHARKVYDLLKRLARKRVVLMEPWIEGMPEGPAPEELTSTPYTYLWDYPSWEEWDQVVHLPIPDGPTSLGDHYHVFIKDLP